MQGLINASGTLGVNYKIAIFQTIEKTLSKKKFGFLIDCKYQEKSSDSQLTYSCFCSFQNQEYSSIIDIDSMEERDGIISDLKDCLKNLNGKSSFSINQFRVGKNQSYVTVYDGSKYTTIGKNGVLKWINWLESINKLGMINY